MVSPRDRRTLAVALLVVVPLAVLLVGNRYFFRRQVTTGKVPEGEELQREEPDSGPRRGGELADVEAYYKMPVYADLRTSLDRLLAARTRLVELAAGNDQDALVHASSEYREAIGVVQADLQRFRSRIPPGDYSAVAMTLLDSVGHGSPRSFYEWELGAFGLGAE